jgi:glutamate 5-kinase
LGNDRRKSAVKQPGNEEAIMTEVRKSLTEKNRIVLKIGSSSLTHPATGELNLWKIERLVRIICDLKGEGKEVVLVSSGAIAAGRQALGGQKRPDTISEKQAYAAVGQARLMMVYQKLFSEYNCVAAQVLLTKDTMTNDVSRYNAQNTFDELLSLGTVPIVNENDTVSTHEIQFGDNDRLSAIVAALIGADLLILLSDIDGLYTDDPRTNPQARFISLVEEITPKLLSMGKDTSGSDVGTGGMSAKLAAARIATDSGSDMIIANGADVDIIHDLMKGEDKGTLFIAHANLDFDLMDYINTKY